MSASSNKSENLPSCQRAPRPWVLGLDARMLLSQACLSAVSLSLYCGGLNLLDVQQLSSLYLHLWITHCWYCLGILADITMCSPILHLMVALYRRIQILLPSLGTLWMVTQERGMIPLCDPNIPLCAHLVSKETLVALVRPLQVRGHFSFALCGPG